MYIYICIPVPYPFWLKFCYLIPFASLLSCEDIFSLHVPCPRMTRWWPAGAAAPSQQLLLLVELIAPPTNSLCINLHTMFYTKSDSSMHDTTPKISMTPAQVPDHTMETEKNCTSHSKDDTHTCTNTDTEKTSMTICKDDPNSSNTTEKISMTMDNSEFCQGLRGDDWFEPGEVPGKVPGGCEEDAPENRESWRASSPKA
jgi:hypothetical protein